MGWQDSDRGLALSNSMAVRTSHVTIRIVTCYNVPELNEVSILLASLECHAGKADSMLLTGL